jgi:hypothetical protein
MAEDARWITGNVRLPQALLDAHAEGRVVFFVGAGASFDAPSSLPLFDELADVLGEEAGVQRLSEERIDHFLGRLAHLDPPYPVRERTLALITNERSQPNALHRAIVELASAYGAPRIVTTNFDDHLAHAAADADVEVPDKWVGPALPLGDTVEGIAHLHGSVTRGHKQLILTDRDLGSAYLADGWAARFLLKLFDKNVVVFIGYGLTDPTLRYLTLGLPSGAELYSFQRDTEADDSDWNRLGVQIIRYGDDHANLPEALSAWNTTARMGQLEHEARIAQVVAAGPALTPVERDYVRGRLRTAAGVRDFDRASRTLSDDLKVEWLRWLEELPDFRVLFQTNTDDVSRGALPTSAAALAQWFASTYIASPDLHGAALQTLERLGQSMSDALYQAAGWSAEVLAASDFEAGQRWLALLTTSTRTRLVLARADFLLPYDPDGKPVSMPVLRAVLRPVLSLQRRWYLGEGESQTAPPNAEVAWSVDEHSLTRHLLLALDAAAPPSTTLGIALEESLLSAYDLLESYHGVRPWDALSSGRSAIESHPQDSFRKPLDAVVDALREWGTKALDLEPALVDRWWSFERPLFQRLALHLMGTVDSRGSDDKLEWLLDRTDLFEYDLKHETYQLLAVTVSSASERLKERVLAATSSGPSYPDDLGDRERHAAYAKYNLLVWLTRSDPGWQAAAAALTSIQDENPEFAPREHPNFQSWMTSGSWGGTTPIPQADFVRMAEDSTVNALEELLKRDYSERNFDDSTWRDATELVAKTAATRADLGVQLWDVLSSTPAFVNKELDLKRAIIEGWAKGKLGEHADGIIGRAAKLVSDSESAYALGRLLLDQVRERVDDDEDASLAAMRELAQDLWERQGVAFTHHVDDNPLSFAPLYLNSWPGFLAQYWLTEIDRRWRHKRDDWTGLNEQEREALAKMLNGPRAALDAIQPAIAGEVYFMFAADPGFTERHVLPLFLNDSTSLYAWHPFLYHPRFNDGLLAAGLLRATIAQWDRLSDLGDRGHQRQFLGFVAAVITFASISENEQRELLRLSVLTEDGRYAADFADEVVRLVADDSVQGSEVWRQWLRAYVSERLQSIPRLASPDELAAWADVVPSTGDSVPDAITMFEDANIGLSERFFVPELTASVLREHGPVLVGFYAARIRDTSGAAPMIALEVRQLIEKFREGVDDATVQPLVDAASTRGFLREAR